LINNFLRHKEEVSTRILKAKEFKAEIVIISGGRPGIVATADAAEKRRGI
jgi:hypothetical protein